MNRFLQALLCINLDSVDFINKKNGFSLDLHLNAPSQDLFSNTH